MRQKRTMRNFPITIFENDTPIEIKSHSEWCDFIQNYTIIEASGGIVLNNNHEVLMIYRLNKWDFPKGKVEAEETLEEAALREVSEETGISNLIITGFLPSTYHTYYLNNLHVLKITHWFKMDCSNNINLTPQEEEDITKAAWFPIQKVRHNLSDSYLSLRFLWDSIEQLCER